MGNAILYRMPSGIPGDVSRLQSATIESAQLDASAAFSGYGLPGKLSSGKFVPLAGGEVAADVFGFLVRPYPISTANADGSGVNSIIGNVLRRGYMTVKLNAGTAANGGQVYARTGNASAGKPVGGIEAGSAPEMAAATAAAGAGGGGSNTGNGTITMDATTPILAGAKAGVYVAKCITAATNGGTFRVEDPDGSVIGDVAVGATFADDIKFVIADGSTDFVVGDGFAITVTANTIAINAKFKAAADASGNVEIEFNI